MALFNVLFDIAARTANIEASFTKIERRFDDIGAYAKKAAGIMGVAFGAEVFREGVMGAIELGDEMGKLADKTGLTASAASQLSRVFKQNDLDNETLTNSMRKMQVELSKGNDVFGKLGLSVSALRSLQPDQAFEEIAQAISQINDPADRARVAVEIFGKTGANLLPLMLQGKDGIEQMRKELGGLSDEDVRRLQEADDAIKKLDILKESFWAKIASGIVGVAEALHLLDKPPVMQGHEELNKLLDQRLRLLAQIREVEANKTGRTQTDRIEELRILNANLDKVSAKINSQNDALVKLGQQANQKQPITPDLNDSGKAALDAAANYQMQFAQHIADINNQTMTADKKALTEYAKATSDIEALYELRAISVDEYVKRNQEAWQKMNAVVNKGGLPIDQATQDWLNNDANFADIIDKEKLQQDLDWLSENGPVPILKMQEATDAYAEQMHDTLYGAFHDLFMSIGTGANNFKEQLINSFKSVLADAATRELFSMFANIGEGLSKQGSANGGGNSLWSAAGSFLLSAFGGARAGGGPVSSGNAYLVGEQGPELFMPGMSGSIVPNGALAGGGAMTINHAPVYNINGSGLNQAQLVAAMGQASDSAVAKIIEMKRRRQL